MQDKKQERLTEILGSHQEEGQLYAPGQRFGLTQDPRIGLVSADKSHDWVTGDHIPFVKYEGRNCRPSITAQSVSRKRID